MMTRSLFALALLLASACSEPGTTPLVLDPDSAPRLDAAPATRDAFPAPDAASDAALDAADSDGAPDDMGAADGMVDAAPPGAAPARDRVVVLSSRDDTWIGWVKEGRLFAARLPEDADAVEDPTDLADASTLDGPLLGYRLAGSRPWVLLPDGEEGMLRAHDLTGVGEPLPLGLYPPAQVEVASDVLVSGRLGPEAEARAGWRLIDGRNRLDPIVEDLAGISTPRTIARALDGWVFGFDSAICLDATVTGAPQAPWRCAGAPGARLVGAGNRLSWLGMTAAGLRLWQAMPAVAASPEGEDTPEDRVTLAAGAQAMEWLARPPAGQLLHVTEADDTEAIWWVRADRSDRLMTGEATRALGLSRIKSDTRLIVWDMAANRPHPVQVAFDEGPAPPAFAPIGECAAYGAEDCAPDVDTDCDGRANGGLCCRTNAGRLSTNLGAGQIHRPWFGGFGDVGFVVAALVGEQVRVAFAPENDFRGLRATDLADWGPATRMLHMDNISARVVVIAELVDAEAEVPEGEPPATTVQVLWFLGPEGAAAAESPCAEPLGVSMLEIEGLARVWCPEEAYDLEPGEEPTPVPYPGEAGPLRWLETDAYADRALLLAARGDAHDLEVWRVGNDDSLSLEDVALPMAITLLTPEERALPLRLPVLPGGLVARVAPMEAGGSALELLVPGEGWRRPPGSAWPIEAAIARFDPVAVTVGHLFDPGTVDPGLGELSYFVHSLQPESHGWGMRYTSSHSVDELDHQGVAFGNYPSLPQERPNFLFGFGQVVGGGDLTTLSASRLVCTPPGERPEPEPEP